MHVHRPRAYMCILTAKTTGEIVDKMGRDPSVFKSNRLHVDIVLIFVINLYYIL